MGIKHATIARMKCSSLLILLVLLGCHPPSTSAEEKRRLPGHVHSVWAHRQSKGDLALTNQIDLAIGLPLRNQETLTQWLQDLYDPTHPNYHHFLTVGEFTEKFGPSAENYQEVIHFAETHGLNITSTHPNRMVLGVTGSVDDVNKAFKIRLKNFSHPTEVRQFFATPEEPEIPTDCPVLHISGLDNFSLPRPRNLRSASKKRTAGSTAHNGSGPDGAFLGNDFRTAYVPGTLLDGGGQSLGLFELDGYYLRDITY